ncbi:hypothetical protein SCUP515_09752 [Seiridium cupressi]
MSSISRAQAGVVNIESHEAALRALLETNKTEDLPLIEALFAAEQLNSSDATQRLKRFEPHRDSIDVLTLPSLDKLKLLLEYGDVVDSRETLDWLLNQGVDINRPDSTRTTGGVSLLRGGYDHSLGVLNNAAARGDIETFDYLLSQGADPTRSRALHLASRCKDLAKTVAMIHHLIDKHGFGVDELKDQNEIRRLGHTYQQIRDTGTPLNCAVVNRNMAALQTLLERGANPEGSGHPRQAPANTAILRWRRLPWDEALEPLFKAGANPSSALIQAVESDNIDGAKICLQYGADLAGVDETEKDRMEENARGDGEIPDFDWMSAEMRALLQEWSFVIRFARDAFFRAPTSFRVADFYLHGNPDDKHLEKTWAKQMLAFDIAIALLSIPADSMQLRAVDG